MLSQNQVRGLAHIHALQKHALLHGSAKLYAAAKKRLKVHCNILQICCLQPFTEVTVDRALKQTDLYTVCSVKGLLTLLFELKKCLTVTGLISQTDPPPVELKLWAEQYSKHSQKINDYFCFSMY